MKSNQTKTNYFLSKVCSILYIPVITIAVVTVLILFTGKSPIMAYGFFMDGIFGNLNGFAEIFVKATPLIFSSVGIAIAFRSGFFNIGAEGQICVGAIAATATALALPPGLPNFLGLVLIFCASLFAGGFWALIAGVLKAKLNISEIITTIMLNYVAINLVALAIRGPLKEEGYLPQSPVIASFHLSQILEPTRLHAGFLLAVLIVIFAWWLMERTTVGYELLIVGANKRAANCNGISVFKNVIISAFLSGGIAGVAGMSEVLGLQHRLVDGISGGLGYTAVLIALMGKNNPIGALIAAICFAAVQVGVGTMQRSMGIPISITHIIIGIVVILVLGKGTFGKVKQTMAQRRGEKQC